MSDILELEGIAQKSETTNEVFDLSDVEDRKPSEAAIERDLPFDPQRRIYTRHELSGYGMVREGYTRQELRWLGFGPQAVTCFDERSKAAEELLRVETRLAAQWNGSCQPTLCPFE